ncbi:MAG TPA: alpha/beta fold hydrolase [Candidatus Kapabacteria bacterium]|nr:alpha/beta fold hydrolase [Candidatus Kapabacteria bacterium]
MPIQSSTYSPPCLLSGGHPQTIYPALFRSPAIPPYRRERIDTPDGDFLDLDWLERSPDAAAPAAGENGGERLAVLCHGLEGNSTRPYNSGMAHVLHAAGWDVLAWNYRGCGGEPNRLLRSYHSGATEDLDVVVRHATEPRRHGRVALIGFSLGGNLVLKYAGERGRTIDPRIAAVVGFSVPCDLRASADRLALIQNRIYMHRFIVSLSEKLREKAVRFPGMLNLEPLATVRTFHQFDNLYTAPLHGFRDAADYWERSSSANYLAEINVPTLIVNALNDPYLAGRCYPVAEAEANPNITLEMPRSGGHVGFVSFNAERVYWSERRALQFLEAA